MAQEFHYSATTEKSLDEAVAALEAALKDRKFGVLWQMDIPSKLKEKGVEFDKPYRVLEVCNPNEAKQVLTQNPMVGYFLPCKVVVYEHEGKTVIGLPKPTVLMGVIGDEGLMETAQRVEAALKEAVDEAAG
ncbi:DUF302 domain-containing protein [Alicyclobacillus macrosporangiidus]|uniref:Uncharacterized conserved protein, DUF302 family n=1 Tax=Alicyclobacillus macrosporangiidus TaxID=392015 RepID=A0A1I7L7U7_9BACL|nr:DUF302 domain-containing protein [Alicyclobacillus macrosporangiidus]SFV05791.1 Uncharacterized conserved protein, DUF302 family [Alicyclobacillus macrosporangiidus]